MNQTQSKGKALITGASSGIGKVYADRLAKRGYDLILVARDVSRLNTIAETLRKETKSKIEVVGADLTKKADLLKIETILKNDSAITLLLNNAGSAVATPLAQSNVDDLDTMIQLNVVALTRLSAAITPALIGRKTGAVINIASVVALEPTLVGGTYSGTKAFVLNFTQNMHEELSSQGIQIQAVLPGATATEIWQRAGVDVNDFPKEIVMTTEEMVDASLVGFDRKELITIPTLPDTKDWDAFEAARKALGPNLSRQHAAARYLS